MFKWLTEEAECKVRFDLSLSVIGFNLNFEFFNFNVSLYIPFPHFDFYYFKSFYNCTTLSPFTRKYKNCDDCRRRELEFDCYWDASFDTGITLRIPHEPEDHDHRTLAISLLGFTLCIVTYHGWHTCCCKNGIERFPTPEECKVHLEYCTKLCQKMFGTDKLPEWKVYNQDKVLYNKVMKFYKMIEKKYNDIPMNDEEE